LVLELYSGLGMRWGVPLRTSGPRLNSKDCSSKRMGITVEEIVSTQRTGASLGEAQNVVISICHAGDSRILEVIGETEHPCLFPYQKRNLSPTLMLEIESRAGYCLATNQLNPSQPEGIRNPQLTVTLTYEHSSHPSSTTLSISIAAGVHHYNEHSRWHSYPFLQTKPNSSPPPRIH